MDPASRTLLQRLARRGRHQPIVIFSILMGDDVDARRGFIVTNANDVRFLDV